MKPWFYMISELRLMSFLHKGSLSPLWIQKVNRFLKGCTYLKDKVQQQQRKWIKKDFGKMGGSFIKLQDTVLSSKASALKSIQQGFPYIQVSIELHVLKILLYVPLVNMKKYT